MLLVLLLLCVLALLGLALIAVGDGPARSPGRAIYSACLVVTLAALGIGVWAFVANQTASLTLPIGLPWLGAHFRLDALSAFFLCVVELGGAAASLYGIGYGQHERVPHRVLPFFPAFLAAMTLVVLAADAFTFLVSWELMSLLSWALVVSHDRTPENVRAGYVYIVMAGLGTLALLLAFGILAGPDGHYAFADMSQHALSRGQATLVLLLVLIGAGSKAGIVPLHAWLPLAHPAAPSHVSALMSGVMTKVAVYAFVRIVFTLLGPLDWHLSMVVIALGGITAVMGVLYALMQHDLKRLLAYHTVENIGIIFVGLGLALAFHTAGAEAAAALAMTAALFHVFNHSVFKSLLFFGAGAVQTATGERDMERLGGLIHAMPATALAFLIGSAAISALPPLNGFASEWLTFQAIFLSPDLGHWGLKFLVPATGAALALAAALAAACFVKAFGISFLGRARSDVAKNAKEVDRFSLAAMFALAALCVIAGAVPGLFTSALAPVAKRLTGTNVPLFDFMHPLAPLVPTATSPNGYGGLALLAVLIVLTAATALYVHARANRATRRGPAWDCGFPDANPAFQYTASSFAQPIRRVFGTLVFRAKEEVEMPPPGDQSPARFRVSLRDPVWEGLYAPVIKAVGLAADRLNQFQFLTVRRYLVLVFIALVALLLVLALWP